MSDQSQGPQATNAANHPDHQPTAMAEVYDVEVDEDIWRRFVRGQSPWQIGQALHRSKKSINETISRLLEERGRGHLQCVRGHVEKLLDEVDLLRQAAWSGWELSQVDKVRKVQKSKEAGPRGGGGDELTHMTETRPADPSFLRALMDCNKRESTLRGIERPTAVVSHSKHSYVDLDAMILQVEAANAQENLRHIESNEIREPGP